MSLLQSITGLQCHLSPRYSDSGRENSSMTCVPLIIAMFLDQVCTYQSNAATQTSYYSPNKGHGCEFQFLPQVLWVTLFPRHNILFRSLIPFTQYSNLMLPCGNLVYSNTNEICISLLNSSFVHPLAVSHYMWMV